MFSFPACQFSSSGGFLPTSISGLALWLDASDNSTITIGAGVSQWNDKSGNGNNATQATGSSQPAYNTHQINSLATLTFNSSSSAMGLTSGVAAGGATCFVVANFNGFTSSGPFLSAGAAGNSLYYGVYGSANTMYLLDLVGGSVNCNGAYTRTGTAHIFYCTTASGNNSIFYDNTTVTSGSASLITDGYSTLGTRTNSEWLDGNLGEIVIYNRILSGTEISQVKTYLKAKWGTP